MFANFLKLLLFLFLVSQLTPDCIYWTLSASASQSCSKENNSISQVRELSSNQSLPLIFQFVTAVVIIIINYLVLWLWTSVCGMLDSPWAVRILTSSYTLILWPSQTPHFTFLHIVSSVFCYLPVTCSVSTGVFMLVLYLWHAWT